MTQFFKKILIKNNTTRILFFIVVDILLILLGCWFAFLLRFDGKISSDHFDGFKFFLIVAPIILIPLLYFQKIYHLSWSYVSLRDLMSLFLAITLGFALVGLLVLLFWQPQSFGSIPSLIGFPRSTVFIAYFLWLIFLGGLRISKRIFLQFSFRKLSGKNLLIVGAGDAGAEILRSILFNGKNRLFYSPIGFVDDASQKRGTFIHGFPVLGNLEEIGEIIEKYSVEEMIIALPSADSKLIKKAVNLGREAGIKDIRVLPPFSELISKRVTLADLREIRVDDLLGREPVTLEQEDLENFISEKRVLITGAAGSIGSELCRQVAKFKPDQLLALDQDETAIFWLIEEFKEKFPDISFRGIICDICDENKFEKIFKKFNPQIVFHSAAYKHVPLMEEHIDEAIKNNINGTKIAAELSSKHNVEKFILISTDKAVNPTSVMGATKRVAEMVAGILNKKSKTDFISVRFGNVLDSRGSIIPIFKEQIKRGGPIKITHSEMERFFMSPSEAVLLVMQAAAIGQGGKIYVLDMGKPIKILDLAKELIKLSGRDDVEIEIGNSPRPGEKLSEELFSAREKAESTKHNKIFEIKTEISFSDSDFFQKVNEMIKLVEEGELEDDLKKVLWEALG